jgi:hypothetical protein
MWACAKKHSAVSGDLFLILLQMRSISGGSLKLDVNERTPLTLFYRVNNGVDAHEVMAAWVWMLFGRDPKSSPGGKILVEYCHPESARSILQVVGIGGLVIKNLQVGLTPAGQERGRVEWPGERYEPHNETETQELYYQHQVWW